MDYFDKAFVLVMILFPAVFTLFIGRKGSLPATHSADEDRRLATMERRLWIWTAITVLVYVALTYSGVHIAMYMTPGIFFVLWFLLALPVVRAKDPGWRGVPRSQVRTATLMRRDELPTGLQRAWIALALVWVLLMLVATSGMVVDAPGAGMWWLMGLPVVGGAELAFLYWIGKRSLQEAEPSVENETVAIRSARDDLRNLKQYGWFSVAAACVLIFSAPAIILIWFGQSALMVAIIIGAGGGALAGIGGGVFGTIADLRRARLNRLCIEQSTDLAAPS